MIKTGGSYLKRERKIDDEMISVFILHTDATRGMPDAKMNLTPEEAFELHV